VFQSILDVLLAKFPDERYATPAAAADALKPFLGSGGVAPAAAAMVPAFKEWLATESHLEMPKIVPTAPATQPKPSGVAPVTASVKPGTAPSPTLMMTPASPKESSPVRSAASKSATTVRPVPIAPARAPVPQRPAPVEEVDVELVTELVASPLSVVVPQVQYVKVKDDRPLWEFDRRDWIMLATGAAGVLAAVGVGYGLAKLVRKKPEESQGEE
jgi:hypothetical protein